MIDETLLADRSRCPACAAPLWGLADGRCPQCGVLLTGELGRRLWDVSVETARLLGERSALVGELRREAGRGVARPFQAPAGPVFGAPGADLPASSAPRSSPEWTPRRVQALLLGLGVALLGVAAIIFVAVSWGSLGVGGRAAIMTGVTALSAGATWWSYARGLASTAEALSLLTVGLALLDCLGAWASNLAGLRSVDGLYAFAGSSALVGLAAAAASQGLRTRALRVSSAVLLQLPLLLTTARLADASDQPLAVLAVGALVQGAAGIAAVLLWRGRQDTRDARTVVGAGAVLAGCSGLLAALAAAYAEPGSLVIGSALLVLAAVAVAVGAEATNRIPLSAGGLQAPATGFALAAVLLTAGLWAPVVDVAPARWVPAALTFTAAALLAACLGLSAVRRAAPAGVFLAASLLPGLAALPLVAAVVVGRVRWLDLAWTGQGGDARQMLAFDNIETSGWVFNAHGPLAVLLAVVAVAAWAGALVLGRPAIVVVAPLAVLAAGLLAPAALDTSYAVGLGLDLAMAAAGLVGGALAAVRGMRGIAWGAAVSGVVALGGAVGWSFGTSLATVCVLPAAALLLAAAVATGRRDGSLLAARLVGIAAIVGLLAVEAGALTRRADGGWPAVAVAGLTALVVIAGALLALAVRSGVGQDPPLALARSAAAAVTVAAVVGDAAALTRWAGGTAADAALGATVAAAMVLAAAGLPLLGRLDAVRRELLTVAAGGATIGVAGTAIDAERLWLALLALGVGVAVVAVRLQPRLGWLAGGLLSASSWVRLALAEVDAPEAYTVAPGLALLAVGWWRRRSDPTYASWPAYGAGLLLALGPSLLRSVSDSGNLRPFLLAVAALAVLAVGVRHRLQAPLVVGGAVLAVDALAQLAPYLAHAYDVVPRWITIGAVGLLLLGAGATYEQRLADVRRVGKRLGGLS